MKKLLFILALALYAASALAMPSAKSIFYADSYMLRATGVEGNYWNPARISLVKGTDTWFPVLNTAVSVSNNSYSLDDYNFFVSRSFLETADKEKLLKPVKAKVAVAAEANISNFGFTSGYMALSSANHFYAKARAQKDILRLALYGNTEEIYIFDKASNGADALAFTDLTLGAGGFAIPYIDEYIPEINVGASISALFGIGQGESSRFYAKVINSMDSGLNLDAEAELRHAMIGLGFKAMLGLYSEVYPNLELGFTLDNIAGNLSWVGDRQEEYYRIRVDSLYALNIEEEIEYDEESQSREIGKYNSKLPPEMRLAAKYRLPNAVFSMDYVQGFEDSALTSATGRVAFAASYYPLKSMPLIFGISLPNSHIPIKTSYGIAYEYGNQEFGIAVQSFDSLIPGPSSKGLAFAITGRIAF